MLSELPKITVQAIAMVVMRKNHSHDTRHWDQVDSLHTFRNGWTGGKHEVHWCISQYGQDKFGCIQA